MSSKVTPYNPTKDNENDSFGLKNVTKPKYKTIKKHNLSKDDDNVMRFEPYNQIILRLSSN